MFANVIVGRRLGRSGTKSAREAARKPLARGEVVRKRVATRFRGDSVERIKGRLQRWPVPAALLLVLLFLLLGDLSASLGRIQVSDLPARSIASTRSTLAGDEAVSKARQAWCLWNGYSGKPISTKPSDTRAQTGSLPESQATGCVRAFDTGVRATVAGSSPATWLVRGYVLIDVVFVVLYVLLIRRWFRRLCGDMVSWPVKVLLAVGLAAGLAKDLAYWVLAWPGAMEDQVDAAGYVLAVAPAVQLVALAVPGLLVLGLAVRELRRWSRAEGSVGLKRIAGALRIQLTVVALFVVIMAGIGQNQVADALLRLVDLDERWWLGAAQLAATLVALGFLSALIWLSAYRLVPSVESGVRQPPRLFVLLIPAALFAVAGWWWRSLWGLVAALLVIVGVSKLAGARVFRRASTSELSDREALTEKVKDRARTAPDEVHPYALRVARWLAAAPVMAVGVAMVRTGVPPWLALDITDRPGGRLLSVWIIGLALLATGFAVAWIRTKRSSGPRIRLWLYWAIFAALGVTYVLIVLRQTRQAVPVVLGPIALVAVFLAVVLVIGNEVQRQAERTVPFAGLHRLGAQRNPVLLFVVVWLVLGRVLDTVGPHAVRTQSAREEHSPMTVAEAFDAWATENCAFDLSSREAVPMVFVAAEGGGIRAAYWTAGVLDTVFPSDRSARTGACTVERKEQVFALSGASGGSVGIAFWLNAPSAVQPLYQRTAASGDQVRWYDTALTADFLSPLVARMLYVDLPRNLFGYPYADRAAVLEESWERSQPKLGEGYFSTYASRPAADGWRPIALLNAAAVESGCRALVSPVELTALDTKGPGSLGCRRLPDTQYESSGHNATGLYDLSPLFLCRDQDIASSTAALLSARFPYVTPSGQLTQCTPPGQDSSQAARTYIVDGGYLDNSGAMSATDLYLRVKPAIDAHNARARAGTARPVRPVFVQIDNGYPAIAQGSSPDRPYELLVPPRTRLAVAGALEPAARQRSYEVFGAGSYLRIANAPHPGVLAPLGWTLSGSAQYELCQELNKAERQLQALAKVIGSTESPTSPSCQPAQGDLLAQPGG
jgi:hypothetical protein